MPSRFLVVDDHPLFIEALQAAIRSEMNDVEIVEAASIEQAKLAINERHRFDLVLLDLSMPGTKGFDGLIELRSLHPRLPIVIVSALEDARIVQEAMACGASGFVFKSVRRNELADGIRQVLAGHVTLPAGYEAPDANRRPSRVADIAVRLNSLTRQQLRVLNMLRQGKLNKQIAHDLEVGETTVKAHVSEILRKLNVASRTQAVIEVSKIDFDQILSDGASETDAARPR